MYGEKKKKIKGRKLSGFEKMHGRAGPLGGAWTVGACLPEVRS